MKAFDAFGTFGAFWHFSPLSPSHPFSLSFAPPFFPHLSLALTMKANASVRGRKGERGRESGAAWASIKYLSRDICYEQ